MKRRPRVVTQTIRESRCLSCGCRDSQACLEGCGWVAVDERKGIGVCSTPACIEKAARRLVRMLPRRRR